MINLRRFRSEAHLTVLLALADAETFSNDHTHAGAVANGNVMKKRFKNVLKKDGADGGNRTHASSLETVARPSSCIRTHCKSSIARDNRRLIFEAAPRSLKLALMFPDRNR